MSEKKVVSRSAAIAVIIICVALTVGLIGTVIFYTSQVSSLNRKVSDLTDIVNLDKFTLWLNETTVTQTANNYTSWLFTPSYAGDVGVLVTSSTSNSTYIRLIYSSYGINYDNTITVGTITNTTGNGVGWFPVVLLPEAMVPSLKPYSPNVEIRVGNTDGVGNATETVAIYYGY
jgi:hypothetical protein